MYTKIRQWLLPVLSCLVAVMLAIAVPLVLPKTSAVYADGGDMTVERAADSRYVKNAKHGAFYGIKAEEIASYETNGGELVSGETTFSLANAFDDNTSTFWMSQTGNSDSFKNHIAVKFTKTLSFKSVRYKSSYYSSNGVRNFSGYPTTLKIYVANGDDNYTLAGTCISTPKRDFSEDVIFSLASTVTCDRLKFEFAEVSFFNNVFSGETRVAAVMDMKFFKSDEGVSDTSKATGNYENASYLSSNSVTSDDMKIRANGGGAIANAFDKNVTTFYTSESYNTNLFTNKITVTLERQYTLHSIVMGLSYYTRDNGRNFDGFPIMFKVTATAGDGTQTVYTFGGAPESDWTYAHFVFSTPLSCKKLEMEFLDVINFAEISEHPFISFSEIFLVKTTDASTEEMLAEINGIFTDYAQYELNENCTVEYLAQLRERARENSGYESNLKPILDRAGAILSGAMKKDVYREFSTDPNAKNTIERNGDLVSYCRNTLQTSSYGTNRQVIGIGGTTGETITIYVEAPEGDPLPSVAFTQIYGAWNSWMRTYQLHRGKNQIVFPNFKSGGSYTQAVNAGGPIHVVNPYTPAQQSSNVKMYIEGGYLYPVFHDGDDEGTFRIILTDYYERLTDPNDTSITIDAFEAVAGNVILSCQAKLAYNSYVKNGSSPQYNVDKWRQYTIDTLKFGGIEFDPDKPYYNEKNPYIKVNYRAVQPYAGMYAFAASEHVGIIDSATFGAMVQKWTLGWAFYHEMGHQLDNLRMKIPEVTNNMWAIYNVYMIDGAFNDRINVTAVSRNLASDLSAKIGNFYENGNYNCDFWWIIEGGSPGYWGRLQQMYCFEYNTTGTAVTDATEKLCLFSSIAAGTDLTEYFERWGFYFTSGKFNANNRFAYSKTSQQFKDAMAAAKAAGRIEGEGKKFWYVNNDQYRYEDSHGETLSASWASCYDASQTVAPLQVTGSSGSYMMRLPAPQSAQSHLCYEIQGYIDGTWKVLGVTYGTSFTDTYAYGAGVVPQYRVFAYDRMFNCTGVPEAVTPQTETQTDVCRIGDTHYDTLKAAVAAANNNSSNQQVIIYLLKDFKDCGVRFSRSSGNITILPDPDVFADGRAVTITKNAEGDLFDMVWGNVSIGSATNNVATSSPIILDGGSFAQSGTLIRTHGKSIFLNNVTLQNNYNNNEGGGLAAEYGTTMSLNGCTIKNNRASNGGGIATYSYAEVNLRGVTITGNVATGKGGGIYIASGEYSVACRDAGGSTPELIISGNSAGSGGGVYTERTTELTNAQIVNNTATNGGGLYVSIANTGKYIQLANCTVSGNEANWASAVYLYKGKLSLNGGKVSGMLYKAYDVDKNYPAVLELKNSIFDFSETQFVLSKAIPSGGLILCESVTGISAEQASEPVKSFNISNGYARFESGVGVKLYPDEATITINYGDGSFDTTIYGGSYRLPETFEELPAGKYVEKYTIGGKEYSVGQTVTSSGNITAQAVIRDYCIVTLTYGTYIETLSLKQNTVYYLPMKSPEGEVVFGWNCSDGKYYAYAEGVAVNGNLQLDAVIKQLHTVVTSVNGVDTTAQYEYGGSMTLPSPPAIFGKAFSHWEIEGKRYAANQTLKVTGDITATAIYTDSWNVVVIVEDSEVIETYPNGHKLVLENLGTSLGREFKYWSIDGVKYYAGATYTVSRNCEIVAVFAQIDTASKYTVTLRVNRGAIYNEDGTASDVIVENEDSALEYAFNAMHTFTKPEVNVGNEFLYWDVNGVHYAAGTKIAVKEAFMAVAVVSKISTEEQPKTSVTVTIKNYVNGEYVAASFEYAIDTPLTLEAPVGYPENKRFSHWEINGVRYEVGSVVNVSDDAEAVAVFEDIGGSSRGGKSKAGVYVGVAFAVVAVAGGGAAAAVIVIKKKKKIARGDKE